MLRPIVLATTACLAGALPAQQAQPLVVLVRDPSGQPVPGARGTLLCEPDHHLPALRGLCRGLFPAVADAVATIDATSDAQGLLRFQVHPEPRAGSGIVTTAAGLGALLPRLRPGRAQRLALEPLAEVTTASGTEHFALWARVHTVADGTFALPPRRGTSVRLPEGSYEVWAQSEDGWTWQRLELASGRRTVLQFAGPAQRVQSRAGAHIHPTHWPELTLAGPGQQCVLLGAALAAPLDAVSPTEGLVLADRTLPLPPTVAPVPWPPIERDAARRVEFEFADDAPTSAVAFSLRRTAADGWLVLGAAPADDRRRFSLPRPQGGDDWLLLVGKDRAPLAVPWSNARPGARFALRRGVPLVVRATTDAGEPAVDLLVDYVPEVADAAQVTARTDGRGQARLGPVTGPGTLLVSDPRFANQDLDLADVPVAGLDLVVAAGARLGGRAALPDGAPASGAVVTLRDPSGRLRPATRAVVAAADGSFAFAGMPEDLDLVLFAATTRDGRTWSGRLASARAGGAEADLVVRCEDPELGPAGR